MSGGWDRVVELVGQELPVPTADGADVIDPSMIRRWCEPLEFGSALHRDRAAAQRHGHPDIIAPYTSVASWAVPAMWSPGDPPNFDTAGRDAQPNRSPVAPLRIPGAPAYTDYFATGVDVEFRRPPRVGDRLRRSAPRLLACTPKRTKVGDGAFLTIESTIADQRGEPVAVTTTTFFYYTREDA